MLGAIPLSPAAQQAVAATFADWRHETAKSSHGIARLFVAMRSTLALIRVMAGNAVRELPMETRSPFIWRVAFGSVVVVLALGFFEPMFPTVASGAGAVALMGLAQGLYFGGMFFPLVVFAAEVTGRSTRRAPSLGSALVMAMAVLVWVAIVAPETLNFMWTIHGWGLRTETLPPMPSFVGILTGAPTREVSLLFVVNRGLAWISVSVSLWSLAVLAYRIRAFAAGSTFRRMAIVWCAVLIATVAILTVAVLPQLTSLARVPYARIVLLWVLAVGTFYAAALLARRSAARTEALALQTMR
jgi:hypothetical protein